MKKLFLAILILAVLLSFTTCKFFDSIFFVAPSVSASDLASYQGTTPTARSDAMTSFQDPGYLLFAAVIADMSTRPEFQNAIKSTEMIFGSTPTGRLIQKAFSNKLARTITFTQSGFNSTDMNTNPNKEIHLDIENETVKNSNVDATATGTITINTCKLDLVGTANGLSTQHPPSSVDITQADADVSVSADNYNVTNYDPNITLHTARIGLKLKSTASATLDTTTGSPTSVTYDISGSLKAGMSFSNSNKGAFSGKYILDLGYYDTGNLTSADLSSTDPYAAINKLKFTLTIKLYDNSNKVLNTWTFDQSDLVDALKTGSL